MFLPHIVQPTRITFHSKTLIDNIFSNYISQDIVSGNLTATISDHLPQFLIAPHIFSNVPNRKTNIFERDRSKFNHEEFILDYFSVDWPHTLKLQNNNIDASFQKIFDSMNNILDKHALFKKITKYKLKFRTKPWISPELQKSIFIKNKIFKNYIEKNDITQKNELHNKYKIYRNLISTLMKRSKQNYYSKYFESNLTNIKNTWKGIKSIISMRRSSSITPNLLAFQNETIDNTKRIANIFNNYFSTIGEKTQAKRKYSNKNYTDYLTKENPNSFFLSPTDKDEIKLILSSLDISKATGPYSISTKVLKLLKNDISDQLADFFNLSFTTGSFTTLLKTAKVIPIHKKKFKLDYTNYCLISLLSSLDKILEKLMHNRLYKLLNDNTIIYLVQFGF